MSRSRTDFNGYPMTHWRRLIWFLPSAILVGAVMVYPALRTFALSLYRMDARNSFRSDFI